MESIERFEKEYDFIIKEIELLKQKKIHKLKDKYAKELPFKKGDIIYNVTGIIKIESINFNIGYNGRGERLPIHAIFSGTKYKWVKGGFITPVKNKQKGELCSYSNLKKIGEDKIV